MYRLFIIVLCLCGISNYCIAESTITLPWHEYNQLYQSEHKRQLDKALETYQETSIFSISQANYTLLISNQVAVGSAVIDGEIISGQFISIPLFNHEMTITEVKSIQGGHLISQKDGYYFYAKNLSVAENSKSDESVPFKLEINFVIPIEEDQYSHNVDLKIPYALQNTLAVSLSEQYQLLSLPGVEKLNGISYFSSRESLTVRFENKMTIASSSSPSVDIVTEISLQGDKYIYTAHVIPTRELSSTIHVKFPHAMTYLDSTLKRSWLKRSNQKEIAVDLPRHWKKPFVMRFESSTGLGEGIRLPYIVDNQGAENQFYVVQPIAAVITDKADSKQQAVLSEQAINYFENNGGSQEIYYRIAADAPLLLSEQRYNAINTPDIVLDAIYFYSSFAENGSVLSVLRFDVTPEMGSKIHIKAIPGAEIWSLTVNNQQRELYIENSDPLNNEWIIPLAENQASVVELSYLQNGSKLGLEGRLQLDLPATGLTAQNINVAIGLSSRVDLIALEGDLVSLSAQSWPTVNGFSGKAHYFTMPYYRGDSLQAAIHYKEPVDDSHHKDIQARVYQQ